MPHNWPTPGGVDPLLPVETSLTPVMRREVILPRSWRFFTESLVNKNSFEDSDGPVLDPVHEVVFNDPPPAVPTGIENAFVSSRVRIVNDGPGIIEYSYDGTNVHGTLGPGESATDDERRERRVFLRKTEASPPTAVRIWAW